MLKHKSRVKAVLFQPEDSSGQCFPLDLRAEVGEIVDLPIISDTSAETVLRLEDWLREASVIVGTWGMPRLDRILLSKMPQLQAVFYAGGAVNSDIVDAEVERRRIRISTSVALNSECTAHFALAQVIFALKLGWQHQVQTRTYRRWERLADIPGTVGSRVGIVSVGAVGRRLVNLLEPFGVELLVYDVHVDPLLARKPHVRYVGLKELFASCHVVSLHTPWLDSTQHMIGGDLISSMRPNGVLINTARGQIINQSQLIEVLKVRSDLVAVLDVTDPEPPPIDSPLWELPNVILTPHIAGAFGHERRRLGRFAIDELRRYLNGEPLVGEVRTPPDPVVICSSQWPAKSSKPLLIPAK